MTDKADFTKVFEELKSIFKPYAKKMDVLQDTAECYMLNTRFIMKNKQSLCFGGVRQGKNYVSFYLMSVYAAPEVDKKLFSELKQLTKDGAQKFSDGKVIERLRMVQERGRE